MRKIEIASLEFDTSGLLSSTADLKKELAELKKVTKGLADKNGLPKFDELADGTKVATGEFEDFTAQIVENEAKMKVLSQAVANNMRALSNNARVVDDAETRQQMMNAALSDEATTIDELRAKVQLLTRLRNSTNVETKEGAAAVKELNDQIDKNNKIIKENLDEMGKMRMNVGNYTESIKEAAASMNPFNGGLIQFMSASKDAGGTGALLTNGLKGMATGFFGAAKAAMAFILTPIGAVITAIVIVVKLLQSAFSFMTKQMNKSEEGSDKLARAMSFFKGVLAALGKVMQPIAEFIFNVFVGAFEALITVAEKAAEVVSSTLKVFGMAGLGAGIDAFVVSVKENAKAALELQKAEEALTEARRKSKIVQLEYQKQAEKLRQLRDDETKSVPERIRLNEQLGAVLKKQLSEELALAKTALVVAEKRIQLEGKASAASLDARAAALTEIADIQERITGQESEQLSNLNSLRKEAADKAKEAEEKRLAYAITRANAVKELWESEINSSERSTAKLIAIEEERYRKTVDIIRREYEATAKTEADKMSLRAKLNVASAELSKKRTELILKDVEQELQIYTSAAQRRLDDQVYFSDQEYGVRLDLYDKLEALERDAAKKRLEAGVLNQAQYNEAIAAIDDKFTNDRKSLDDARKKADQDRRVIDLENEKILKEQDFYANLELERQLNEIKLQQELSEAEKSGADKQLIREKYAKFDRDLNQRNKDFNLSMAEGFASGLGEIMGEMAEVSKAVGIFQATIDTYRAINGTLAAFSGVPIPGYAIAQAAAIGIKGFVQVAKIGGAKFERGGTMEVGGKRHVSGGTKFWGEDGTAFEAEKGELIHVMKRGAASHFNDFNDSFDKYGNFLGSSGGGIVRMMPTGTDTDTIASVVMGVVSNLPSPIVTVQDINTVQNQVTKVVDYANLK